ncbi:uncharacterized protein LY89DRAFT_669457 [Mollisia scopiformis]|uniref:Uncharacterized protein n=1 Tax=Mollisia scopiformis TaxID=149040 RepID=A0A194XA60_MOLSC|nr:uncharacterized protein LY89DRAFT_669457 [Mollisia scopiformis]KUJ17024.1 hypothetical protein LY89DRAFT_669457 [Mollisia scopiformis]
MSLTEQKAYRDKRDKRKTKVADSQKKARDKEWRLVLAYILEYGFQTEMANSRDDMKLLHTAVYWRRLDDANKAKFRALRQMKADVAAGLVEQDELDWQQEFAPASLYRPFTEREETRFLRGLIPFEAQFKKKAKVDDQEEGTKTAETAEQRGMDSTVHGDDADSDSSHGSESGSSESEDSVHGYRLLHVYLTHSKLKKAEKAKKDAIKKLEKEKDFAKAAADSLLSATLWFELDHYEAARWQKDPNSDPFTTAGQKKTMIAAGSKRKQREGVEKHGHEREEDNNEIDEEYGDE